MRFDEFSRSEDIAAILDMKRIAVVGLSEQPERPSYDVARYLQTRGYTIIPVNPNATEVLGEKAYPDLASLPEPPEVVDIFRRSEFVSDIVDQAIEVGAKAVWMQFDVIDSQAALRARKAGLLVVMDRCMKVEHWQRSGRLE